MSLKKLKEALNGNLQDNKSIPFWSWNNTLDEKELEKTINDFVKNLPEKERNVFIRRYFFFENPKEIGERYSFSQNRVSVILHRTRKKLLEHLKKEGFYNE